MAARRQGSLPLSGGYFPSNCKCLSTPAGCEAWKKEERRSGEISSRLCLFYSLATSSVTSGREKNKWSFVKHNFTRRETAERLSAESWQYKRDFWYISTIPRAQCPSSTLSGTDSEFSGRSSILIGLFTSVCNARDPLSAQDSLTTVTARPHCLCGDRALRGIEVRKQTARVRGKEREWARER